MANGAHVTRQGVSWQALGAVIAVGISLGIGVVQLGAVERQVDVNSARLANLEQGFIANRERIARNEATVDYLRDEIRRFEDHEFQLEMRQQWLTPTPQPQRQTTRQPPLRRL